MNLEKLREFFSSNDVRIGEDFDTPLPYYFSLYDAFYHYFLTSRDVKESLWFYIRSENRDRHNLAWQFTGNSENVVFTILSFHRFFEILLKDILGQIDPKLKAKFPTSPKQTVAYIDNTVQLDEINTIEAGETLKRFKEIFKYYDKDTKAYADVLHNYDFLNNDTFYHTFEILTEWRNKLLHSGSRLMNILALDYLVTQRVIPVLSQIVILDCKKHSIEKPFFFNTATGIDIISEILSVKFSTSDFKGSNTKLSTSLLNIGHLKELGLASYHHNYHLRYNFSYYEPTYKDPVKRSERFAKSEEVAEDFYNIENCLCCGVNSLVVYKHAFEDKLGTGNIENKWWARCYNCDYAINGSIGDPFNFNLTKNKLFD